MIPKKNPSTLLLVDFNNLLFRGMYVHEHLSHKGICTGGLFGFMKLICSYVARFPPNDIIVCKDSPPYHRKKRYPGYKAKRKKDVSEEIMLARNHSRELCDIFLHLLNITVWEEDGWEADDLMAEMACTMTGEYDRIILLSNDDDLFQLLDIKNLSIQRSKTFYSIDNFKKDYPGLSPKDWIRVNALSGGHNDIPGLWMIGEKKALKILRTEGMWEETYKKNKDVLDLYLDLVTLPYPSCDLPEKPEIQKAIYPERQMILFLSELGITLTQSMRESFELIAR